jgi:hypothetical protein
MKRKIIAIVVTVVLITLLISNIYIKAFAEEKKGTYTIIATPPITTDRARKLKEKEAKERSGRGSIFTELYQGKKQETSDPKGQNKWNVPLMLQSGITLPFGSGTVSTHGCGPAVCAMIMSSMNKQNVSIEELAVRYNKYSNPNGSDIGLLKVAASELSNGAIEVIETKDRKLMLENLKKGNLVAALVKDSKWAPDYIHWVVYRDITEDGKVYINDSTSIVNTNSGPYNLEEYEGKAIRYAVFVNRSR